jgi:hypothetical protein
MKLPWRGALGLALTVFLLWWAFHEVHWGDVRDKLRDANPLLVALSVAIATMVFPLRAIRWRSILDPVAPNLPFGPLWRATAMGFMANNVLPTGRMGEIVRPYALSREAPVPFAAGLASLVVDRVFDAIVVLVLTLAAMLDPRFPSSASPLTYLSTGAVVMGGLASGLYAVVYFPDRLIRLFEFFVRRVAPRFEDRGRELLRSFAAGLSVLRSPRRFVVVLFWAFALWLTQAFAFWLMFVALGIDVPFSAALFVQGLIVLAVALPSTPGFFGLFEAAAVTALGFYGVDRSLAITWGFTFHVLTLIPITLIGLYYLAKSGMKLGDLRQIER